MTDVRDITLQVNVAPSDHWHIRTSLEHHMRTWAGQVDEVLFSVDTVRSPGRRGAEWEEGLPVLRQVLTDMQACHPNVRVVDVDYGAAAEHRVSAEFFGGARIPRKDCFGAPFYAYLHGLNAASNKVVLHLDADMLFGGGSQSWLSDAMREWEARPDVLVCAPLPGPPSKDGVIPASVALRHHRTQRYGSPPITQQMATLAYGFTHMSTRVFVIDRAQFNREIGALKPIRLLRPTYPRWLGHPAYFPLETVFSRAMHRRQLIRLNMLGRAPGMWYMHPPARQPGLGEVLPRLVQQVESGAVPTSQLGDDQVNDGMVSEVRIL